MRGEETAAAGCLSAKSHPGPRTVGLAWSEFGNLPDIARSFKELAGSRGMRRRVRNTE